MQDFISALSQFHFLRPLFLLAIIPGALLIWGLFKAQSTRNNWQGVIDADLLQHLRVPSNVKASSHHLIVLAIVWLLSCLALAGPSYDKLEQAVEADQSSLVIVLDLSLSMMAKDEKPSRLIRAKRKIQDVLDQRQTGLTGLVVYSGDAHVVTPLTQDTKTISNLLQALEPGIMPSYGSNVLKALELSLQLKQQAQASRLQLLLISDEISAKDVEPAARFIQQHNINFALLTLGTPTGAPIPGFDSGFLKASNGEIVIAKSNPDTAKQLASLSQGRYSPISLDDSDIDFLIQDEQQLTSNNRSTTKEQQHRLDQWLDAGFYLVIILVPLSALAFRRGYLLAVMLCIGLQAEPSYSFEWQDLWQRQQQQAQKAYQQGDYETAADKAQSPDLKADALYQQGKYAEAQSEYQQSTHASADFNRGLAAARQKQYDKAAQAFKQAAAKDPRYQANLQQQLDTLDKLKQLEQDQQNQDQQNQDQQNQDQQNQDQQNQDQQNQDQQNQDQQSQDQQSQDQQSQDQQSQDQQSQDQQSQDQQSQDQQSQDHQNQDQQALNEQQQQALDELEQTEQQQREQQQTQEQEQEQSEQTPPNHQTQQQMLEQQRQEQQLQQWLRKVPDDPGGLLRNKFQRQYQQNQQQGQLVPDEDKIW